MKQVYFARVTSYVSRQIQTTKEVNRLMIAVFWCNAFSFTISWQVSLTIDHLLFCKYQGNSCLSNDGKFINNWQEKEGQDAVFSCALFTHSYTWVCIYLLWFECDISPKDLSVWIFGSQLVVLFGKVLEPWAGRALLEEMILGCLLPCLPCQHGLSFWNCVPK